MMSKKYRSLLGRLVEPVIDINRILRAPFRYLWFLRDWFAYSRRMAGSSRPSILDIFPVLTDQTASTPFDTHYFYQDIWAFRRVLESRVNYHVDVGSLADFVGFLSSITNVIFVDIRPLRVSLDGLESVAGSILSLPFKDDSVHSLSCLHVAEHIGLGRYGDPLDPDGTKKAIKELARVLAPGGALYLGIPIGKPRVCFNAHRIHSNKQILEYCSLLDLIEFSGIDDHGVFRKKMDMRLFDKAEYACGLFYFQKRI